MKQTKTANMSLSLLALSGLHFFSQMGFPSSISKLTNLTTLYLTDLHFASQVTLGKNARKKQKNENKQTKRNKQTTNKQK
jgi:hypothetical protein